jgi:hypothetical protein
MPSAFLAAALLVLAGSLPTAPAQCCGSCGCSGSGYYAPQWGQGVPPGFVPTAWGQGLPWGFTPTSWMPGHFSVPCCAGLGTPEIGEPMPAPVPQTPQIVPAPAPAGEVIPLPRQVDPMKSK